MKQEDYVEEGYDYEMMRKELDRAIIIGLLILFSAPIVYYKLGLATKPMIPVMYAMILVMLSASYLIVSYTTHSFAGLVSKAMVLFAIFMGAIRFTEQNYLRVILDILTAIVWWFQGPVLIWFMAQMLGFILYHLKFGRKE